MIKADDTKRAEPRDTQRNTTYVCGKWKARENVAGLSFMISQSEEPVEDPLHRTSRSDATAPFANVSRKFGLKKNKYVNKNRK